MKSFLITCARYHYIILYLRHSSLTCCGCTWFAICSTVLRWQQQGPTAVSQGAVGWLLAVVVVAAGRHPHTGLDLARSGHRRSEASHEERREEGREEEEEGTMGTIQSL